MAAKPAAGAWAMVKVGPPRREYEWFRPFQAAHMGTNKTATNSAAIGLYNNSTAAQLLVVRAFQAYGNGGPLQFAVYNLNGHLTNAVTGNVAVVSTTPTLPGVLYTDDLASLPTIIGMQFVDVNTGLVWWPHDFPISIIEPGWSFVAISQSGGRQMYASFLWEALTPNELDRTFG